ncbi:MAG: 1-acyl-sn-glycerol-3-phosphate acyltransferase [Tetrasphaera sp.]
MTTPWDDLEQQRHEILRAAGEAVGAVAREVVRNYHRLEVQGQVPDTPGPVLFVGHHGYGGLYDLNTFASWAILLDLQPRDRPLSALAHGLIWSFRMGSFAQGLGCVPANADSAAAELAAGHDLMVFPGGDLEAAKTFRERDQIRFHGRSGFARLAIEHGIPIVPLVVAGAGETAMVLASGETLAKVTRIDKLLRMKALPVALSLPFGLTVGTNGLPIPLPYLPLPAKLVARVLAPMPATEQESPRAYAARVEAAMQVALTELTRERRFLRG